MTNAHDIRTTLDRLPFTSEYPERDALIPSMIPSREDVLAKLLALEAFAKSGVFAE